MSEKSKPEDLDPENWIKPDFWGKPKWTYKDIPCIGLSRKIFLWMWKIYPFKDRIRYEEYFASQLRARYLDLEGDFRTIIALYLQDPNKKSELDNIKLMAFYTVDLLKTTRTLLEKEKLEKVDLLSGSSLLDQLDQCMIWIMPINIKIPEIESLRLNFDNLNKDVVNKLSLILDNCELYLKGACGLKQQNDSDQGNSVPRDQNTCNAMIEGVIEILNKNTLDDLINTGLQIERLRSLRFWGVALLLIFILVFPNVGDLTKWPLYTGNSSYSNWQILGSPEPDAWYAAVSLCIIGAIGGFLSGLLQVRSSRTNLGLYEESVLLFQIRPIFGAFAALVTFMLMSWGTLSQIIAESHGAYVLSAFLSGFSERYFLKLLMNLSEESEEKPEEGEGKSKESGEKPQGIGGEPKEKWLNSAEENLEEKKGKTETSEVKAEEVKEKPEVSEGETSKKDGSP